LDIQAIQDERALEFCGEHIRKYDLMRWGIFASTLIQAQKEMKYFTSYESLSGTPYDGLLPEKFYYQYTTVSDAALAISGQTQVMSATYGLTLGENGSQTCPSASDADDGDWIKGDLFNPSQPDLYACPSDVLEYRQYWPIFTVLLAANPNLWNDYGY